MQLTPRFFLGLLVWVGLAFGVALVGTTPGDLGNPLCGPWGCSPPVQALAAMHALWLLLLTPPMLWIFKIWPPARVWWTGVFLTLLGFSGVLFVVGWQALTWLQVSPDMQQYFPMRIVFMLAVLTDYPIVEFALLGVVSWALGWFRLRRAGTPG